jgi:hypothetical protein
MFWWIVLGVVVVGFALAWWTSGRTNKPLPPGRDRSSTEDTYISGDPFNTGGGPT